MMFELIMDLLTAGDFKEREQVYRRLEKVGVDRMTANTMAAEFYREWETKNCDKKSVRNDGQ